jgi:hypothetical protein
MKLQWLRKSAVAVGMIGASAFLLNAQTYRTALPGTINYVEGQASIDGQPLNSQQNGQTVLHTNQTVSTANGHVEILLSPGVFARTDNNTDIRMVSSALTDPTIEVLRGSAMIEVDQKLKDARVDVLDHGATVSILKSGLYRFDANPARAEVIDGKLAVAGKDFGKGKEVMLNGEPIKPVSFDRKSEDELYRWSSVRSGYLAEVNGSTAQYVYAGGPFWGSGWYWNPWFASWSWLPGDGFFYSPFGYPFYSPAYVVYSPYRFGYGYRGGFAGAYRGGIASHAMASRGFAAGAGAHFAGGGFHGGRR